MFGHLGWSFHIVISLQSSKLAGKELLTLISRHFAPKLQTFFDEAGVLARVGIKHDLEEFNAALKLLYRKKITFFEPVDLGTVARLAGIKKTAPYCHRSSLALSGCSVANFWQIISAKLTEKFGRWRKTSA
jgi:hypothetical protein